MRNGPSGGSGSPKAVTIYSMTARYGMAAMNFNSP
jgi:hypothetical protein